MNHVEKQNGQKKLEPDQCQLDFINSVLLTINQGRVVPAILENFSLKRVTLRVLADKISVAMSMGGEKLIKAYLVAKSGNILMVESVSEATCVQGKGELALYIFLNFNISKVKYTSFGNIYNKKTKNRMIDLFNNYISYLKSEGSLCLVESVFPVHEVRLGIQFFLEHNASLDEFLGGETVYQPEKRNLGEMVVRIPEDKPMIPNITLAQKGPNQSHTHQSQIPSQSASQVAVTNALQDSEELAAFQALLIQKGVLPSSLEERVLQKTPDIAEARQLKHSFEKMMENDPSLTYEQNLTHKVKSQVKIRAEDIKQIATAMSWSESSIDKIMIGDGNYLETKSGINHKKNNHRVNFRLYFYDFPAMIFKDEVPMYARIINISETGAGIGMTFNPDHPVPPLAMGDEIVLVLSIVNLTNFEIRGRIVRDRFAKDENGGNYYYYGIRFHWSKIGAPLYFIESIRKTELFLMSQKHE